MMSEGISQLKRTQSLLTQKQSPGMKVLDNLQRTFVRNVSHELRTPLAIIQGYVELLQEGEMGRLAPEQQRAVNLVGDHVLQLRTLVERITTLMAIEAQTTASLPFAVGDVVVPAVEAGGAAAEQAGLDLSVHVEENLPLVHGDPDKIRQALECLLENALKFTPAGGRIEVRAFGESGWVDLQVADTGIGIAPDDIERLQVTPFFQVDSSTKRRYGGLGLGLTLVRAVVSAHGGQLLIESEPGQGSRFTIKLPVSSEAKPSPSSRPVPRRILVVDDEQVVALTLQAGLARLPNCEIQIATSGEQALRLFEQQVFDLLITDYKMPGTDGLALAAQIRQRYPQTVIIMITAYGDYALREQAARLSIRRVLDKPVALDEIRRMTLETFNAAEEVL